MINKELIEEKYRKMKRQAITEDFLDFEAFGELKVFLNHEPELILFSVEIDVDIIYVGGDYL